MPRKRAQKVATAEGGRFKEGAKPRAYHPGETVRILPPDVPDPLTRTFHDLTTLEGIRTEMADVYKMGFCGVIPLGDCTRLVYMLDNVVKTIRTEHELEALAKSYADAWTGFSISYGEAQRAINGGGNGHAAAE